MFGKLKMLCQKKLKKLRIFSRLKAYKAEILMLKDLLIHRRKKYGILKKELIQAVKENIDNHKLYKDAIEKKKKASKHIANMVTKRNEFLKRIQGKIPDDVISGKFDTYKVWLMEPFMEESFIPYKPSSDREVFIDGQSAIKGLIEVSDVAIKKEEEKTD
jgi:hypothetical protein